MIDDATYRHASDELKKSQATRREIPITLIIRSMSAMFCVRQIDVARQKCAGFLLVVRYEKLRVSRDR